MFGILYTLSIIRVYLETHLFDFCLLTNHDATIGRNTPKNRDSRGRFSSTRSDSRRSQQVPGSFTSFEQALETVRDDTPTPSNPPQPTDPVQDLRRLVIDQRISDQLTHEDLFGTPDPPPEMASGSAALLNFGGEPEDPGNDPGAQAQAAANALRVTFTDQCYFERTANGRVAVTWDNGRALNAIRGAAIDYIPAHFHVTCTLVGNVRTYSPGHDLHRLIAGGVSPKLALIVVGLRRAVMSIANVTFNLAEVAISNPNDPVGEIPLPDFQTLVNFNLSFNVVIDQALTILGLNAISVLSKGHHFHDGDPMWNRLESAVNLDEHMGKLGISDYAGVLYHDALHPIDLEWKVGLATNPNSPLFGHINGVLMKRLPGMPAGCSTLFVALASAKTLVTYHLGLAEPLRPFIEAANTLTAEIVAAPLNFCAVFQRAVTKANLDRVSAFDPLAAFIYGLITSAFGRKTSQAKSIAFRNNSLRYPAETKRGSDFFETIEVESLTMDNVTEFIDNLGLLAGITRT